MSSVASKTGLLASPKKRVIRLRRAIDISTLTSCTITRQIQFSLRPFGGLFNPYSRGCSILCNHPAALEIKNVVKQAKEAWIVEGKALLHKEESGFRTEREKIYPDLTDHVPEEFFRRYTDTDSRPLTPTPTVASGRTRTSAGGSLANARRCVTPEPSCINIKERKQLILDLRRSHSQETLYWNASSELSPAPTNQEPWNQNQNSNQETKIVESKKIIEKPVAVIPTPKVEPPEPIKKEDSQICINARDDDEEDDEPRRRGKKRKKSKSQTTLVNVFHASQDPETQVATIGPDSPNLSTRPSLIPNSEGFQIALPSQTKFNTFNIEDDDRSSCFLDDDALKILWRGLNLDVVENAFERCMNRALREAYRTIPSDKLNLESDAVKILRENMNLPKVDHEKWITLPRKYSRRSSRFELPLDSREFTKLSALDYVSKYVTIGKSQKQIYRRVFTRYLPEETEQNTNKLPTIENNNDDDDDDDDDTNNSNRNNKNIIDIKERKLPIDVFIPAMKEALGFHGTTDKIVEIRELLNLEDEIIDGFNFRTWCGIIAFSERFLNRFDRDIDPCDEIEIADFESLERRINSVKISNKLFHVLRVLKYK